MDEREVIEAASGEFEVLDLIHMEDGVELIVRPRGSAKEGFLRVYRRLSRAGYTPRLRRLSGEDRLVLDVQASSGGRREIAAPILLVAALATVMLDAYIRMGPYVPQLLYLAVPALVFIAVHEGVELLVRIREGQPALSYVVPGVPGIMPFMGFISSERVAVNRDSLFDEGFFPLVASFAALFGLLFTGFRMPQMIKGVGYVSFASYVFGPVLNYGNPIALGAAISLVTAVVNFMPLMPLDGGIMIEGMRKYTLALELISVIIISLFGYFLLALILIYMQGRGVEVLDEVSELSQTRRRLYWALLPLALAAFFLMALP